MGGAGGRRRGLPSTAPGQAIGLPTLGRQADGAAGGSPCGRRALRGGLLQREAGEVDGAERGDLDTGDLVGPAEGGGGVPHRDGRHVVREERLSLLVLGVRLGGVRLRSSLVEELVELGVAVVTVVGGGTGLED